MEAGCLVGVAAITQSGQVPWTLSHDDMLHDHIHAQFCMLKWDMYGCEGLPPSTWRCARTISSCCAPDNGKVNMIFAAVSVD